ncbi:MAG TPA: AAA family ATPase, partial [Longimicrobium sp.]|nr:AAA family ATPase [Longimicrobium sp.]
MLQSLTVSNFRSLGPDVQIPLGRLTVLVGPNGSGKSNVLDALGFLGDAMRTGLDAALAKRDGIGAVQRWSATRPYDVSLKVNYADGEYEGYYGLTLGSRAGGAFVVKEERAVVWTKKSGEPTFFSVHNGKVDPSGLELRSKVETDRLLLPVAPLDQGLTRLYEALRGTAMYSIYPDALRRPAAPDPTRPMRPHGENWTTSLKEVLAGPNAQEFRAGLAELTGDVVDVRVKTLAGYTVAEFKHLADAA